MFRSKGQFSVDRPFDSLGAISFCRLTFALFFIMGAQGGSFNFEFLVRFVILRSHIYV